MAKEYISVSILPKNWGGGGNKNRKKKKKEPPPPNYNLWKIPKCNKTCTQSKKHSKSGHMVSGLQQGAQFTELIMTTMTTAMMVTGKYSVPTILGTG